MRQPVTTHKPTPSPMDGVLPATARVELHRNVHCPEYNACIGQATRKGWAGFSCAKCPLFSQAQAPRAETFLRRQDDAGPL
jgi:hypothetical protein